MFTATIPPTVSELLAGSRIGLFSAMPTGPWSKYVSEADIDTEIIATLGDMPASRLMRRYIVGNKLNVTALASHIFTRHHENWERIWDAIHYEYVIDETKSSTQTRRTTRELDGQEIRNLLNSNTQLRDLVESGTERNTKSGSVTESHSQRTGHNTSGSERRNLTSNTSTKDAERTEGWNQRTSSDSSTVDRSGSESLTKSGSENHSSLNENGHHENESGSENRSSLSENGHHENESGRSSTKTNTTRSTGGVGGVGPVPSEFEESVTNGDDSRNSDGGSRTTESGSSNNSRNSSGGSRTTESGSSNSRGSEVNNISTRDVTNNKANSLDKDDHATNRSGTSSTTDGGTVTTSDGGEGWDSGSNSTSYNGLTDNATHTNTDRGSVKITGTDTGSVGNKIRETTTDEYNERGSSALGSFQDAINDELAGRAGQTWAFYHIVISDIKDLICGKVYYNRSSICW